MSDSLKKYHENFRHGYGLNEWAAWRTRLNDRLIYHTIMGLNATYQAGHDSHPNFGHLNLSSLDINDMLNSINVNPQLSNFISSLSCFKDSSFIDFDSLIMFGLPRVFVNLKDLRLNENSNNNNHNNINLSTDNLNNEDNANALYFNAIDNNNNPPPPFAIKEPKSFFYFI